ncbi:MAG: aspartate/glutamate racemase family protein [Rhodospirillaceae bacterium]|nr:aspartate/glutamate racemase family protein [Rhodospirillaceae bacterium]
MSARILVINPNSSKTVTEDIARALDGFRLDGGPTIDCMTLADGPPGIETQRHVDEVVAPLCRAIERERADAFVIACFSDPGLHAAREATGTPVFGIAQCGILSALARGERFGVVAILQGSIPRHRRYVASLGLSDRMAGERAIGLGVTQLAQEEIVADRIGQVAERLRDEDGADAIVLGCAGMARYRAPLEAHLGCPVIDPSQAAVGMALAMLRSLS